MASYATLADLATTIPPGAISSLSPAIQQAALDRASTEADGYLANQYQLPLTTWGTDLTTYVCQIAAYRLMTLRGYNPEGADEIFRSMYDDAVGWLKRIGAGGVSPPGIMDTSTNLADGGPVVISGATGNIVGGYAGSPDNGPGGLNGSVAPYPYMNGGGGRRGW